MRTLLSPGATGLSGAVPEGEGKTKDSQRKGVAEPGSFLPPHAPLLLCSSGGLGGKRGVGAMRFPELRWPQRTPEPLAGAPAPSPAPATKLVASVNRGQRQFSKRLPKPQPGNAQMEHPCVKLRGGSREGWVGRGAGSTSSLFFSGRGPGQAVPSSRDPFLAGSFAVRLCLAALAFKDVAHHSADVSQRLALALRGARGTASPAEDPLPAGAGAQPLLAAVPALVNSVALTSPEKLAFIVSQSERVRSPPRGNGTAAFAEPGGGKLGDFYFFFPFI